MFSLLPLLLNESPKGGFPSVAIVHLFFTFGFFWGGGGGTVIAVRLSTIPTIKMYFHQLQTQTVMRE